MYKIESSHFLSLSLSLFIFKSHSSCELFLHIKQSKIKRRIVSVKTGIQFVRYKCTGERKKTFLLTRIYVFSRRNPKINFTNRHSKIIHSKLLIVALHQYYWYICQISNVCFFGSLVKWMSFINKRDNSWQIAIFSIRFCFVFIESCIKTREIIDRHIDDRDKTTHRTICTLASRVNCNDQTLNRWVAQMR